MPHLRATCALALALLCGLPAWGQSAPRQHNPQNQNRRAPWVVADFNGDDKPDLVSLSSLAGEPRAQFGPLDSTSMSAAPLYASERLRARDLDGDADRDLVLETEWSVAIAVWINDGSGHFKRANLEDFRFQLSRDESRTIGSSASRWPLELTDESPRCDVTRRLPAIGLQPAPLTGTCFSNVFPRATSRTGPGPRAPPSLA